MAIFVLRFEVGGRSAFAHLESPPIQPASKLLALVDLMDFIFEQNEASSERSARALCPRECACGSLKDLTFPEFMDIVLDLRGDNAATVRHSGWDFQHIIRHPYRL